MNKLVPSLTSRLLKKKTKKKTLEETADLWKTGKLLTFILSTITCSRFKL